MKDQASKEPISHPGVNAWSEPVNGLSGRLLVEFEHLRPGLRHAVYLELRNHSFAPIAVINQPGIRAELYDSAGNSVGASVFPTSGPIPEPQWAIIPSDAYLSFRIDMQTVGVPTAEHGAVLLALGGKSWGLRPGAYTLRTAITFSQKDNAPSEQWIGELELPPVEVVVTTQMLETN
jgi:hypothetical protein